MKNTTVVFNNHKRLKKVILMALRCDFFSGPVVLTRKGRGFLSAKQWRFVNSIICLFSKLYRDDMLLLLTNIKETGTMGIVKDEVESNAVSLN